MKAKSPRLIFEESFTFNIPGDLDDFVQRLKDHAAYIGYDLGLNFVEATDSYSMTLSSGNSRMKDLAFGHISHSEEGTIVEGTVGIEYNIILYYSVIIIMLMFFLIASAGTSYQFSLMLVAVIVFLSTAALVAIKSRKKGLLDL